MLVLSRRREQKIVIGDSIEVFVLHVGHEEVKLGIRAPTTIPVYRGELYEQIASHNKAAAAMPTPGKEVLAALRKR